MGCCASLISCLESQPALEIIDDDVEDDEAIDLKSLNQLSAPIILLIGGPGVYKTLLGKRLASEFGYNAIISSELVRMEVSADTERGRQFKRIMLEGHNLPDRVILRIIQRKMLSFIDAPGFIIVGFPRTKNQAKLFNKQVKNPDIALFIWVRRQLIEERMRGRAVANERFDDTENAICIRINGFFHTINDVLKVNKNFVTVIDGQQDIDDIFKACRGAIDNMLTKPHVQK